MGTDLNFTEPFVKPSGWTNMGIDPGANGGIAIYAGGDMLKLYTIPKIGDSVNVLELCRILLDCKELYKVSHCVIEDVHSIFGSSAKSNFQFGWIVGILEALLVSNAIPFTKVAPKTWQKQMHEGIPKMIKSGKTSADTKAMSLLAAKRLFPTETFLATAKSSKPHDGLYDAALLAVYSYRNFTF